MTHTTRLSILEVPALRGERTPRFSPRVPPYLGFSNTLMGITVLPSGFGGLAVDLHGFGGLSAVAAGLYAAAYALATGLPEPRVASQHPETPAR